MLKKILGLLGWLGVALVFAAVAIRFLRPEWEEWVGRLSIAGLVCVLLYILSDWRSVARSFSGREARYGSVAIASIAIVLAILIGINFLANRRNKRWDLTAAKQFTLSDQTKKVLSSLQKPVVVRVFTRAEDFDRYRARLDEFKYVSNKVSVEYVDVEKRPALATQYGVQQVGTVVFDYDGRVERVTSDAEQELTNGLIKVVQGTKNKVYFVQGHGERALEGSDQTGYSTIAAALKSDNFEFDGVVLAQVQAVPADATVVVVAGPRTDLFPAEIEMLKAYLARGGKIFFLLDPPAKPETPDLINVIALLKEWAIEVGNNVVVDASGMGQMLGTGPEVPLAAKYRSASDYRSVSPAHGVRDGSLSLFDQRRSEQSLCAEPDRDQSQELGGDRHQETHDLGPGRAGGSQGRQARARVARLRRFYRRGEAIDAAVRQAGRPQAAGDADRGDRRLGFRLERMARDPRQSRSVHEFGELARAAGEHDFDPSA